MLGAPLVSDSKLFIAVARSLTLTPRPTPLFVHLALCLILVDSTFATCPALTLLSTFTACLAFAASSGSAPPSDPALAHNRHVLFSQSC